MKLKDGTKVESIAKLSENAFDLSLTLEDGRSISYTAIRGDSSHMSRQVFEAIDAGEIEDPGYPPAPEPSPEMEHRQAHSDRLLKLGEMRSYLDQMATGAHDALAELEPAFAQNRRFARSVLVAAMDSPLRMQDIDIAALEAAALARAWEETA